MRVLRPRKHLDLDTCTLRVVAIVLAELTKRRVVRFDDLRNVVVRRAGEDAELSFLPALDVLFLLGRVDYLDKTDSFEFVRA